MAKLGALESPLEALALDYLSYGFLAAVNSVWAWIAVVTAAVSFWRIRALSSSPPELRARSRDAASTSSTAPPKEPELVAAVAETRRVLSAAAATSGDAVESECMAKTKFSLYYEREDFRENDKRGESDEDTGGEVGSAAAAGRFGDEWQRMLVVRMGDLGWYRWQDTAVLDGSVVRLWGRRTAAGGCRFM